MVSQESSMEPNSSGVHQFIISDTITNQNHFEEHEYPPFQSDGRNRNLLPRPLGALPSIHSLGRQFSRSVELFQDHSLPEDSQNCGRRHVMNLFETANERDYQGQRLSLTLGSHLPSHMLVRPHVNHLEHTGDEDSFTNASSLTSQNQSCSTSYETELFATVVGNSRYLKPAQSLLEEVVSVGGNAIDLTSDESIMGLTRKGIGSELQGELYGNESSSAEDHEIRIRISKLVTLLNEVESRYEKYYRHMEEVVSTFEMLAGLGAAKSYTAQALQAMSRHFCSLRAAIITQIRMSKRQLSRDSPRSQSGVSQLKLFDQLVMIQNRQTWRPARGLPENAAGILRSWLFKNFLHPYPTESEKLMLASQTGLSKNQIANWFINARVRLWKPMIEELHKDEFAESSKDSSQPENTSTIGENFSDQAEN